MVIINTIFVGPSDSTNSLLKILLLMKLSNLINSKIITSTLLFIEITEGNKPFIMITYILELVKKIIVTNYPSDDASIVKSHYCKIKVFIVFTSITETALAVF